MHPALERLAELSSDTETIDSQLQETGWLTGKEAQQLMAQANALPALIAMAVEIEAKVEWETDGGSNNYFADGYQSAIRDIAKILNKHLEPLK